MMRVYLVAPELGQGQGAAGAARPSLYSRALVGTTFRAHPRAPLHAYIAAFAERRWAEAVAHRMAAGQRPRILQRRPARGQAAALQSAQAEGEEGARRPQMHVPLGAPGSVLCAHQVLAHDLDELLAVPAMYGVGVALAHEQHGGTRGGMLLGVDLYVPVLDARTARLMLDGYTTSSDME